MTKYVSIRQAAKLLGKTPQAIYASIKAGKLKSTTHNGKMATTLNALEKTFGPGRAPKKVKEFLLKAPQAASQPSPAEIQMVAAMLGYTHRAEVLQEALGYVKGYSV